MAVNAIGGMNGGAGLAAMGFRNSKAAKEDELIAGLGAPEPQRQTTRTAGSERDYRAWQATEEGFARLRVNLQTASAGTVETRVSQGRVEAAPSGASAVDKFREYMEKSPAEKMRDAILAEMGLTEEEIDAMPPEQQEAVEKEIAERFQQRMEIQAKEREEERQEDNPTLQTQA